MMMLIFSVLGTVTGPLQNAVSRHYERQSDRYALAATGKTDEYISAFEKLARLNKDDPDPHPLEIFLFHGHPSIAQRLAMAEQKDEG